MIFHSDRFERISERIERTARVRVLTLEAVCTLHTIKAYLHAHGYLQRSNLHGRGSHPNQHDAGRAVGAVDDLQ